MLSAYAPRNGLFDVRYRNCGGGLARFFLRVHAPRAASTIVRIGQSTDVYVGCAVRIRRRGRREDIAPTALLWADCDGSEAFAALLAFTPAASAIIASGGEDCAHAYWALTRPLGVEELERCNRRLAATLGADPRCADAARVLRIPGTRNFKELAPRPVELLQSTHARYRPEDIVGALPLAPRAPATTTPRRSHSGRRPDPLLTIAPARYVQVLTGREPTREGKIRCPFHDDGTPSLHVYPDPERGWTCFGCTGQDGSPLGGDIYTLASLLWGVPARGRQFLEVRAQRDALFGVRRA
ncbi:MAG: DNA-primase RepB domain-containing protein [Solirubrobacteraceae bacterium]